MPSPEQNTATVNRYLELLAKANAEDIAALYADDATVEDPVGSDVHIGRQAITGFYSNVPGTGNEEAGCHIATEFVPGQLFANEAVVVTLEELRGGDRRLGRRWRHGEGDHHDDDRAGEKPGCPHRPI